MALYQDVEAPGIFIDNPNTEFEKSSERSSEFDSFIPKVEVSRITTAVAWPWKAATALFATTSLLLSITSITHRGSCEAVSYRGQLASSTDFPAAREAVELLEVKFNGNPAFDLNGTAYIPNPGPVDYFGEPSHEVDKLWEELSGSYNFLISEEEARQLWPNDYQKHWDRHVNGYPIGLDVFHTLHCINDLRKFFHPDHYPIAEKHIKWQHQHRDHCLDQLRQYVMCAGDMTPYGTLYYEGIGYNYADSDVTHTCRNFEKLREWTTRRYHQGGKLHMPGVEIWE